MRQVRLVTPLLFHKFRSLRDISGGGGKRHPNAIIAQLDFVRAEFLQSLQAHQRALLQMGTTIHDLEEAELRSAPQFGRAGDSMNSAGNGCRQCSERRHAVLHRDSATNGFLLDVRELSETAAEEGPEALSILDSGWKAPSAPW